MGISAGGWQGKACSPRRAPGADRGRTVSWILTGVVLGAFLFPSFALAGRPAPDFRLRNWDGRLVSLADLRGKVVVLTFSYSNCQVTCPIITGRFLGMDEALGSPAGIRYLHLSVDPEMDTPQTVKKYFRQYGIDVEKDPRWLFLTGSRKDLEPLWRFYGITMEKKVLPLGYVIEYTPKVVLLDRWGRIREEVLGYGFSEARMLQRIRELLQEVRDETP